MGWKDQFDKAVGKLREAAESETARDLARRAQVTARVVGRKVKEGAVGAAESLAEAGRDPGTMRLRFLAADLRIEAPTVGLTITRRDARTLVVSDGAGNGLVVDAAADSPWVIERIGEVIQVDEERFRLGPDEALNLVTVKG